MYANNAHMCHNIKFKYNFFSLSNLTFYDLLYYFFTNADTNIFTLTKRNGKYKYNYIWVKKKGEYEYKYIRFDNKGKYKYEYLDRYL